MFMFIGTWGRGVISESSKFFSKHSYEKIMHIIIIQITLNHIVTVVSTYIPTVKIKSFKGEISAILDGVFVYTDIL